MAQLAFASKIHPFATARRRCEEAIALAEEHGWGAEPILAPALVALAGAMALTGELDDARAVADRATARPAVGQPGRASGSCCRSGTGCCTPAAAASQRPPGSLRRPKACVHSWWDRTCSRTKSPAGCWSLGPG